jgi:hypothetical protein
MQDVSVEAVTMIESTWACSFNSPTRQPEVNGSVTFTVSTMKLLMEEMTVTVDHGEGRKLEKVSIALH